MSGRIADFAVARSPGVPDPLFVAAATGGAWKTTDWGTTWDPVFDSANGMSSIGDVTVAPSNPNLVWVGAGDRVGARRSHRQPDPAELAAAEGNPRTLLGASGTKPLAGYDLCHRAAAARNAVVQDRRHVPFYLWSEQP